MVFQLFFKMVLGQSFNWEAILKFLAQVSLGAYVSLISIAEVILVLITDMIILHLAQKFKLISAGTYILYICSFFT